MPTSSTRLAVSSIACSCSRRLRTWADNRVRRSRERLVTTQEEERRRLQRDLYDGLGPTLAAITLKLDAAGT
jgi:signal transduction histidine kinase